MPDIVTVTAPIDYKAFRTPNFAFLAIPDSDDEGQQFAVEDLPPVVLDALAKQWLDHLYARCGRASPFKLIGG